MKFKKILAGILVIAMLVTTMAFTVFADDEADYTPLGLYTANGYENEYFEIDLELPSDFVLTPRGIAILSNVDPVEESNKEETLSFLSSMLNLSNATVFEAQTDNDFITITVESPGLFNDYWDEEKVVAENSIDALKEHLEELSEEDLQITDIDATVDYIDDFAGDDHAAILYVYSVNGIQVYGVTVMVRSDDKQYMMTVNVESFTAENIDTICSHFTELD